MNTVMNIQQWKDINHWCKHICSHPKYIIKNQLGDWTKPVKGQGMTCRALNLLRLELSDHMKWVSNQPKSGQMSALLILFCPYSEKILQELWQLYCRAAMGMDGKGKGHRLPYAYKSFIL